MVVIDDVFSIPTTADFNDVFANSFTQKMISVLANGNKNKQKPEIVGWYDSHSNNEIWLSSVEVAIQTNNQKSIPQSIAIIIDALQTSRIKHIPIGAFRCKDSLLQDRREVTSFHILQDKPTKKQIARGLNIQYYQLPIVYLIRSYQSHLLESLHDNKYFISSLLSPKFSFQKRDKLNLESIKSLIKSADDYKKEILDEANETTRDHNEYDRVDSCQLVQEEADKLAIREISQTLLMGILPHVFK